MTKVAMVIDPDDRERAAEPKDLGLLFLELLGLPSVIEWAVAQLLHRDLEVRDAVPVGGDAVSDEEVETVSFYGGADELGSVSRAEPRGSLSVRDGCVGPSLGEVPDAHRHHRR